MCQFLTTTCLSVQIYSLKVRERSFKNNTNNSTTIFMIVVTMITMSWLCDIYDDGISIH